VPRVSALVVAYNTRDLLLEALTSLAGEPDLEETIVVDNASSDGTPEAVASQFPQVRVVRSATNLGFAAGTNVAARKAHGRDLLLLNPDAALCPGALQALLGVLDSRRRAAAVGPALVYPGGRPQDSAFRFPGLAQVGLDLFPVPRLAGSWVNGRVQARRGRPVQIDHPLGACMLIRREAWEDVGLLDEGYFMYVEEVDWCRRARRRGWEIWHHPGAVVRHRAGSATRQHPDAMFAQLWRSRLRYYQRFHGPAYNRAIHALVRVGMAAATRRESGSEPRRRAVGAIRELVG
jgi:N-acetylglucosaminyl-diphospho-decaprenol L-rhamnosyltransferase